MQQKQSGHGLLFFGFQPETICTGHQIFVLLEIQINRSYETYHRNRVLCRICFL